MKLRTTLEGQSISDYLIRLMPDLRQRFQMKPMVDPRAARCLFAIWKNEANKLDKNMYRRPTTISSSDLEAMQKAELIKVNGNDIEITEKGAGIIKVMVLGDNSSIYDRDDDRIIDYAEALKNTKSASVRRGKGLSKKASSDWWDRFE